MTSGCFDWHMYVAAYDHCMPHVRLNYPSRNVNRHRRQWTAATGDYIWCTQVMCVDRARTTCFTSIYKYYFTRSNVLNSICFGGNYIIVMPVRRWKTFSEMKLMLSEEQGRRVGDTGYVERQTEKLTTPRTQLICKRVLLAEKSSQHPSFG